MNLAELKLILHLPLKLVRFRYVILGCFLFFQLLFLYSVQHHDDLYHTPTLKVFDQSKSSLSYRNLLKSFDPKHFIKMPLKDRCEAYFDLLYEKDPKWKIADLKDMSFSMDVLNKNGFYNNKYREQKENLEKEGKSIDQIDTGKIFQELTDKLAMNDNVVNLLMDNAGHLRIYGKCYTENSQYNHPQCLDIESRLFPFLTFEPPIAERWDGTMVMDYLDISEYYKYDEDGSAPKSKRNTVTNDEFCNLRNLKSHMKGRGIVISIGDQFIDEIVNLIKVLRFHKNKLPIQFVHKGDLLQNSKERIIELARKNISVPKLDLVLADYQQEVWFIDAKRCFAQEFYPNFNRFANKWVLVLFNSFEEMYLMDSDAVPFLLPNDFYKKLPLYQETGAYFFKDRESGEILPNEYKNMFVKMLPTEIEDAFFDIPASTNRTLETKFMKNNARHFMEAGVVMMNRKQHLQGILMAVHIQFWGPLNMYIYGEKEIFWLGQSIAGDENYAFNPNPVGAIGVIDKKEKDHSIIGSHPAHIGPDDQSLLWVNSGMETCKKHSWEGDFKDNDHVKSKFSSMDEVKEHYLSPLKIEGVIIPPDLTNRFGNDKGRPEKGWSNKREYGCDGYYWIAHSTVGDNPDDPNTIGKEIEFTPAQKEFYNRIAQLWVYDYEYV